MTRKLVEYGLFIAAFLLLAVGVALIFVGTQGESGGLVPVGLVAILAGVAGPGRTWLRSVQGSRSSQYTDVTDRVLEQTPEVLTGKPLHGQITLQSFAWLSADPNTVFQSIWLDDRVLFLRTGAGTMWTELEFPSDPTLARDVAETLCHLLHDTAQPGLLTKPSSVLLYEDIHTATLKTVGLLPGIVLTSRSGASAPYRLLNRADRDELADMVTAALGDDRIQ